ncbi:hypothetical protein C7I87_03200 [Mesorhizobium sp. SARCC-RB16n]|nr:hypothetical protein C7I87_03200 [Mesorhizobium sp. SARCC-RB16n]
MNLKSTVVTIIAIVATFGLSFTARLALHMPIDWLSWIECTLIPILIGIPVGAYISLSRKRSRAHVTSWKCRMRPLRETHDKLAFVHRKRIERWGVGNDKSCLIVRD